MKITKVRLRRLEGKMPTPPIEREERLRRPTDIYPHFKAQRRDSFSTTPEKTRDGKYKVNRIFVQIETDEGVTGIAGPVASLGPNAPAFYIDTAIRPLLIGQDPLATEYLWDIMYRSNTAGRKGDYMRAVSMIDLALWDLKGKWVGKPVVKLLGGPTQEKIPAYISTLGYSLELDKAVAKVKEIKRQGYTAMKWFFTEGPQDGAEGIMKNIELMEALRETAGPEMKIMIDAWKSWDMPYTLKMGELLGEFDPYWFEEPVIPDFIESYAELRAASTVLIAGGEQEYTRWGFQLLMDMKAMDIYQPEPVACGGISEALKICNMASARDVPAILHCGSLPANLQISFAQSPAVTPMMEYLILSQLGETQFFFKNEIKPVKGYFYPPTIPGLYELDEKKIQDEHDIGWRQVEV